MKLWEGCRTLRTRSRARTRAAWTGQPLLADVRGYSRTRRDLLRSLLLNIYSELDTAMALQRLVTQASLRAMGLQRSAMALPPVSRIQSLLEEAQGTQPVTRLQNLLDEAQGILVRLVLTTQGQCAEVKAIQLDIKDIANQLRRHAKQHHRNAR